MEQKPEDRQSTRSAAIAAVLAIIAGAGIGYALMLATDSNVVGIVMASPIAFLTNSFLRKVIK